jgi:hypothetical protein
MQRGRRLAAIWLPLIVAALLRAYPMHVPYLGIELQELYPKNAVVAFTRNDWEPVALNHGGGLLTVMRAIITAWYGIGALLGVYHERLDLLAAYVRDPFPFVIAGRVLVLACSLATFPLVAHLARKLSGDAAAVAATLLLAVTFMHVRETHHVWMDVPAGLAALAAVIACLRAAASPSRASVAVAGAAGGAALAMKYSMFPIALPVLLAVWMGAPGRADVVRRAVVAGAAGLLVFATLSPYTFVKFRDTVAILARLREILFGTLLPSLSLATCVREGIGIGIASLALIGLVASARAAPRPTAIAAVFPVVFMLLLTRSAVYSRYLAAVAPFAAVFAGTGAMAIARAVAPVRPLPVLVALVIAVGIAPAAQCAGFDRLLARRDTRQLAADWIQAHVPPGTTITVPNAVGYPNPTLPPDALQLRFGYAEFAQALRARGFGDPTRVYPMHYLGFFAVHAENWTPDDRFVVTAYHPVVIHDWYTSPEQLARLEAAGARQVARFDGFVEPLSPHVLFERVEWDYVPLSGFDGVLRPGPNLIVWELPARS